MAKRLSTEARRKQLLEAGKRIFAERAYDQVSTDELAAATGTSKGLLYHYFGNKRGFYMATIRASADDLLEVVTFSADPGDIAASIDGFVAFVQREGGFFRAVVRGGIGADSEVEGLVGGVREEIVARVLGALGIEVPTPVQEARVWGWLGFVEGLAIHWVERRPLGADQLRDLLLSSFASLAAG